MPVHALSATLLIGIFFSFKTKPSAPGILEITFSDHTVVRLGVEDDFNAHILKQVSTYHCIMYKLKQNLHVDVLQVVTL